MKTTDTGAAGASLPTASDQFADSLASDQEAPAAATPASSTSTDVATVEAPTLPPNTVTLDQPITRGNQKITHVTIRRPRAGELRGVQLVNLLQMDVVALQNVLPRVTIPTLHEHELRNMDPADLVQLGSEVAGFLLPKGAQSQSA